MVRRGLSTTVVGHQVQAVEVAHPRAVRRQGGGEREFVDRLSGRTLLGASRRGKYLWLPLDSGDALVAHLGMSGQLLVQPPTRPSEVHLRVRLGLAASGQELRFVDQRTFGTLSVEGLEADGVGGMVPGSVAHIARDPLDPDFDDDGFFVRLKGRRTGIKRALLDQRLVSGIGNIYADEALWAARLHFARPTETLRRAEAERLLAAAREVMVMALEQGGTSFDAMYVNVNGESGYFERGLEVYGRRDLPCSRCGAPIARSAFMNRSSFTCPVCQPRPRRASW